jgi:hypothetical protein
MELKSEAVNEYYRYVKISKFWNGIRAVEAAIHVLNIRKKAAGENHVMVTLPYN